MSYNKPNASEAREPLLKAGGPNYGSGPSARAHSSGSSTSGMQNGRRHLIPPTELDQSTMRWKQVVASLGIMLSGGAKIAHEVLRFINHERGSEWFRPVPGMILIYWICAYGLQLDYVFMLGHVPTENDTAGYGTVRLIASRNIRRFFGAHFLLFLWQLFLIFELPIFALISICFAFFTLCIGYTKVHKLWQDRGIYSNEPNVSPSFLQGPMSSLVVFIALVHIPSTLIILITTYHPHTNADAIAWPFAWWILFVNIAGSHIATRRARRLKKANAKNNALQIQISERGGDVTQEESERTIPVDLAGVLGLFWGTLAIAAGTGSVISGPVIVIGYIGTLWQALALFGSFVE